MHLYFSLFDNYDSDFCFNIMLVLVIQFLQWIFSILWTMCPTRNDYSPFDREYYESIYESFRFELRMGKVCYFYVEIMVDENISFSGAVLSFES